MHSSRFHKALKVTGIILGGLVIIIIASILFLTTPPGESFLRSAVQRQLRKALMMPVSIGSLETNLYSYVHLETLRIDDLQRAQPMLSLSRLRLRYRPLRLLKKELRLESIGIDGLEINLYRDSTGALNLPFLESEDTVSTPSPLRILLNLLELRQAEIRYDDQSIPLNTDLSGISLWLQQSALGQYTLRFSADSGRIQYAERWITSGPLRLSAQLEAQQLHIAQFEGAGMGLRYTGTGNLDLSGKILPVSAHLMLTGNPSRLVNTFQGFIPAQLYPVSGDLNLEINLHGSRAKPELRADLRAPHLQLGELPLGQPEISLNYLDQKLTTHFSGSLREGTIQGKATIRIDSTLDHTAAITLRNLNLETLLNAVYQNQSDYQGNLTGELTTSGSLAALSALDLNADLHLLDLSYRSRAVADIRARLRYQAGRGEALVVQADSRVEADFSLDRSEIQGQYRFSIDDLEPLAALANIPELSGQISGEGRIAGSLSGPDITGNLKGARVRYRNFPIDYLDAALRYQEQNLKIDNLVIKGDLPQIDPRQAPFQFSDLGGGFQYQANLNGTLAQLFGEFKAEFQQPSYQAIRFHEGSLRILFAGDQATLQTLTLQKENWRLAGEGQFSLTNRTGLLDFDFSNSHRKPDSPSRNSGHIHTQFDLSDLNNLCIELNGKRLLLADILAPFQPGIEFDGVATIEARFNGSLQDPEIILSARVDSSRYRQLFVDRIDLKTGYAQQLLRIDTAAISISNGATRISGLIRLSGAPIPDKISEFDLDLKGNNLPLIVLDPWLPAALRITGYSQYDLAITGNIDAPIINGYFGLENTHIQTGTGTPDFRQIALTTEIKDNLIHIRQLSGSVQQTPFVVHGQIGIPHRQSIKSISTDLYLTLATSDPISIRGSLEEQNIDLQLDIKELPLAFLPEILMNPYQIDGKLTSSLQLHGTLSAPELAGEISVREGFLQLSPQSLPLRLDSFFSTLRRNRLNIRRCRGTIGLTPYDLDGFLQAQLPDRYSTRLQLRIADQSPATIAADIAPESLSGSVEIPSFDLALTRAFLPHIHHLQGDLNSSLSLSGKLSDPCVKGNVNIHKGSFQYSSGSPLLDSLAIAVIVDDSSIRIATESGYLQRLPFNLSGTLQQQQWHRFGIDARLALAETEILALTGKYHPDNYNLKIGMDGFDLNLIRTFLPDIDQLAGTVNADLSLTGPAPKSSLAGSLILADGAFRATAKMPPIENISSEILMTDTLIDIRSIKGTIAQNVLEIKAAITTRDWSAFQAKSSLTIADQCAMAANLQLLNRQLSGSLTISDLNIATLHPFFPDINKIGGQLNTSIVIGGPLSAPSINGQIGLDQGIFQVTTTQPVIDRIEISGHFSDTLVTIEYVKASIQDTPFQLTGAIGIRDYSTFHPHLNLSLAERPAFSADGSLSPQYSDLEIRIADLDLNQVNQFLSGGQVIQGVTNARMRFRGNLAQPSLEGRLDISGGLFRLAPQTPPVQQINLGVRFVPNGIHIEILDAIFEERPLSLTGSLATLDWETFQIQAQLDYLRENIISAKGALGRNQIDFGVRINEFDIAYIAPLIPNLYNTSGLLSADMVVRGNPIRPEVVGYVRLTNGFLQLTPATPDFRQIDLDLKFEKGRAELTNLTGLIRETPIALSARVGTQNWQKFNTRLALTIANTNAFTGEGIIDPNDVDLRLQATNLNLSYLQPFVRDVQQLGGLLNTQITVRGTFTKPDLDGQVSLSALRFKPSSLPDVFSDGTVQLGFRQTELHLSTFSIKYGGGSISSQGFLRYENAALSDIKVSLIAENIKINQRRQYSLQLKSAKILYQRQNGYFDLEGDIYLGESRFKQNFSPVQILAMATAANRPSETQLPTFLQQTRFNLRLRKSTDLWIDNNLARVRLYPEITLIGNPAQPNISGRVSIQEGYILYLDRKFTITRGTADFIDPHRINPIIDFSAAANIKAYQTASKTAYTVTLSLTGPLDELVTELSSQPTLEQMDIVALLTVGATRAELINRQGDISGGNLANVLQGRLTDYSSQRISGFASQKIGTLLNLEDMSVEGNLFDFGKSWGPQLLASKKISERATLTFTSTVGHINDQSIRLDYKLTDNVSLEGQTDQKGRSGIDLKYQLKFK